jgi:hypothetical protein
MENYNRVEKDEFGTYYYLNDDLHRLDGPAVNYEYGDKFYYVNNKLHRIIGPAAEYNNGYKEWYYEDKYIECNSQEEFERYLKLKLFW